MEVNYPKISYDYAIKLPNRCKFMSKNLKKMNVEGNNIIQFIRRTIIIRPAYSLYVVQ